jgi:hypothetical protein
MPTGANYLSFGNNHKCYYAHQIGISQLADSGAPLSCVVLNGGGYCNHTSFPVGTVERTACSFGFLISRLNKLAACSTWLVSPVSVVLIIARSGMRKNEDTEMTFSDAAKRESGESLRSAKKTVHVNPAPGEVEIVKPRQGIWRTYDVTDGLPTGPQRALQDRRGYLWLSAN